jgi:hypothetical protein
MIHNRTPITTTAEKIERLNKYCAMRRAGYNADTVWKRTRLKRWKALQWAAELGFDMGGVR